MSRENIIQDKSFKFAIRVVKLAYYLKGEKNEYILSKQILKSGTSIGAMVKESKFAQSNADFINKLSIALKEANETEYWLSLLYKTDFLTKNMFQDIHKDIIELIKILSSIVKKCKLKI